MCIICGYQVKPSFKKVSIYMPGQGPGAHCYGLLAWVCYLGVQTFHFPYFAFLDPNPFFVGILPYFDCESLNIVA